MSEQPNKGEAEQRKKPGPLEKLHSLHPLTFDEAVRKILKAKPAPKKTPKKS